MSDLVIGIDVGTTTVKAAALRPGGGCVARFAEAYPTQRPEPGRVEQDPDDWVRLCRKALAEMARTVAPGSIMAAGLCSQVNTHVFVDADGRPLMPAIVWQDTRATAEALELDAMISTKDKIAALGAPMPIDASHPLARMLWVARHLPEVWERTAHVLLPKDYVQLQLTDELATDPLSNIGLVGPDKTYAGAILDLLPGAAERLAPIRPLAAPLGALPEPFGGVQFVSATMDGWAGLVGGGAVEEGAAVYLSGTSEILGVVSDTVTNEPGIAVFASAMGLRLHAGPTQSGGASAAWFSQSFGIGLEEMSQRIAATPRRAQTPLFLPQLAGERAPLWNPALRGAFLGLDSGMDITDLARGVFEGVALSALHVQKALEASSSLAPDTLFCGGGGFGSDAWAQIRADILGRPLQRLSFNEPGVIGAACIAATTSGGSLQDAHALYASYDTAWDPDPAQRGLYDALFDVYTQAIETLEPIGGRLTALPSP